MGRFLGDILFWGMVTLLAGVGLALTPDGMALLEFKRGLTETSPTLKTWKASDASPCSWGGISCTASGEVQNITLSAQVPKLRGDISSSLGTLKSLQGLRLEHNLLSGSIPSELGNLGSLLTLSLSNNSLIGKIPPQLGMCRNLVELWLDYNELTGVIPKALGNLRNLSSVFLGVNLPLIDVNRRNETSGFNVLTGSVPPMLYKNMNLRAFDVSCNSLSGDITPVFEELSTHPGLEWISAEVNSFSGALSPSIGNATSLWWMNLYRQGGGGFGGEIPKEIGKLTKLTYLDLGENNFSGEIPHEIGNLVNLEVMSFKYNNLTGKLPPELGNMASLKGVNLERNKLSGAIPSSLGNLTNLEELNLGQNNLIGPIPSSLAKLIKLQVMILYLNQLIGPIPDFITSLTNLKSLGLQYNGLIGPIPTNISKLTSLVEVDFEHNKLSGPMPKDFGMFMPNLEKFAINNNFINGTLPDGFCKSGKLQMLDLSNNQFEGAIPLSLARCSSLIAIGLMDNHLTSVPDYFGSNSSLERFSAARNQLSGQLPKGFGTNSKLAQLDLNDNKFSGDISVLGFHQLAKNLSILNLANNYLTGEIPIAMGACILLFRLDLSQNFLTGGVPLAFENLRRLETLRLQGNNLTIFPPTIYSSWRTSLRTLNLAENPWNMPIASEIGSLNIIATLNLSYGGYTGLIPLALGKLTELEVLDLSHNNLEGPVPNVLGELMVSLVSVNISFNRLRGPLPVKWVKFLKSHPNSFLGNPGLCLEYNTTTNQCVTKTSVEKNKRSARVILVIVLGSVFALVILLALLFWWLRASTSSSKSRSSLDEVIVKNLTKDPLPFTFEEIMVATENLSETYIIGQGGHGIVYKVESFNKIPIVVKKIKSLDRTTTLIHKSFWSEIKTVGNAKHRNLVKMLGFIKCGEVGLLLYDYVSNGDLHSALHNVENQDCEGLTWKSRLRIAQGVANGLAYLHHEYDSPIVHRDIKSSNVLLDNDLEAHISDFGLAKVLQASTIQPQSEQEWLSTPNVSGTFGYIAPEVGYGTLVTPKLDVYSFGVLLLELLSGRKPVDKSYGESWHVVAWMKASVQGNKGNVMNESVLDPLLVHSANRTSKEEMMFVQKIALLCTTEIPFDRPTMKDVAELLNILPKRMEVENKFGDLEVGESSSQLNKSRRF